MKAEAYALHLVNHPDIVKLIDIRYSANNVSYLIKILILMLTPV
jgi:hypothetical protein